MLAGQVVKLTLISLQPDLRQLIIRLIILLVGVMRNFLRQD